MAVVMMIYGRGLVCCQLISMLMTKKFDKLVKDLKNKYGEKEVETGLEVEKEHDDITKGDELETAKIAAAHLKEKPDYYKRLKKCVEN